MRRALVFAALLLAGCPSSTPAQNAAPDGQTCGRRLLGGMWRFTGFSPFNPTDPQALRDLETLHGQLRLGFDGQNALTQGAGINHVGPYRVDADSPYTCSIVAPDDSGFVSKTDVRFLDPNTIEVIDQRSQMPGRATMVRVPVGQ